MSGVTRCIGQSCLVVVVGFGWERDGAGWRRTMLRQCPNCRHVEVAVIHHVDADYPFCYACFAQDFELACRDGIRCTRCQVQTCFEDVG